MSFTPVSSSINLSHDDWDEVLMFPNKYCSSDKIQVSVLAKTFLWKEMNFVYKNEIFQTKLNFTLTRNNFC